MLELQATCARRTARDVVFDGVNLHIERGDRIALIGPNGAGKSTLMRMLSGVEAPDAGTRTEGHQVVMQYFAQDEATRLDPTLTVYQTLAGDAPIHMVPHIRNILGGFLFSGDDVDKPVRVLSGGERTRLAVARMLLRPSNTLLLDEPTNHLDLDSKDVLLEALEDFGGTLIFVSHDRYFVDKLATQGHRDRRRRGARSIRATTRSSCGAASSSERRRAGEAASAGEIAEPRRAEKQPAPAAADAARAGRETARRPAAANRAQRRAPSVLRRAQAAGGRGAAGQEGRRRAAASGSRSSRRGSPNASRRSRRSRPRCRRPGSTRTTRPPSR